MVKTLTEEVGYIDSVKENEVLSSYDLIGEYMNRTPDGWNDHSNWHNFNKWNNWPNH